MASGTMAVKRCKSLCYNSAIVNGCDRHRCWLRYDTHFIWAFIVPVILILMVSSQ